MTGVQTCALPIFEAAFDPTSFAGAEETGTTDSAESSSVSIQTALGELDLVDLVVVGELYLYNPPIVDADGDGVPDDAAAEPTPADGGSRSEARRVGEECRSRRSPYP